MDAAEETRMGRKRPGVFRHFGSLRLFGAFCVVVLISAAIIKWVSTPPFPDDPLLTRTTRPSRMSLAGQGLLAKLAWTYFTLKTEYLPNPRAYTMSASASPESCSIHGLLNQCMSMGGTEYLIEKGVSGGSVMFGPTNVLNGEQWIKAFETALQVNQPEWYDPKRKTFRHENLVFLRHGRRTVLVLSQETARKYEKEYPRLKRISPP